MSFASRWLRHMGMAGDGLDEAVRAARRRAGRYPWPLGRLHHLVTGLVDRFGPLLALGRPGRACRLAPAAFDRMLARLRGHRSLAVRSLMLLVVAPLMEALTEEASPPALPHPLEPRLSGTPTPAADDYDLVVIGSGAGGAPLAWRLAERGQRVAIVERGGLVRPATAPRTVEEHYIEQGIVGSVAGGAATLVLAGSTIGGTTSINSGTCLPPATDCLKRWDARLGTRFASGELAPYVELASRRLGVGVPSRALLSASAALFETGLAALGRDGAYVLPRNAPGCEGIGRCCFGCPTGAKQGTDLAYLPAALAAGAELLHHTEALGIREDRDGVEVEVRGPEGRRTLRARRLVIAAGALFTPGLLRRNRLGRHARAGRRLKIHPATKVVAWFPGLGHGERGVPQGMGYRPPELPRTTLEGIHTPHSVLAPVLQVAGKRLAWWLERADDLATFGLMQRDRATGTVRELLSKPLIDYRLHPQDAREIGAGVLLIARAFLAAGARRVLLPVVGGGIELDSRAALERIPLGRFVPRRLETAGFHPQGTAGMGRVVDCDLRLAGSRRIFVCDASVLPDSPGVNPQITIMALSLRLADLLTGR